ncbi:ATP-dependent helicase HrpB [Aureimonas frigidaquae]|uniref:ATP-dependent helicase HRPB n=1 Tax=Aureimonas frigidaquae TaxID=424757 RepID=A0A0P0Z0Y4_9HYPH|nr:ATP-dependent helicase HrpB [Aureimonas frigidaquae]BAT27652.1 ATP-dependent helicase HRPB [Aureimonas frigidaquae]
MTPPSLPDLPVVAVLPELGQALVGGGRAVLVAPPGAGKTSLVPLHLLSTLPEGRIILIEPRRLAARAAAARMAALLGETVGQTVGWRMRLDTRIGRATRIEVVTEGVFTRLILDDPELAGIACVIFDEFHERSLDADFGLALALDVRSALRDDLSILVMSATLDGARVAELLAPAPIIQTQGRSHPVEIVHRERGSERIEDAVATAIRDALAEDDGSILAFLPGQREIERVAERLSGRLPADVILAPLYGALDTADQDIAIRPAPAGRRKVVLATSIAQTSITIDGVRTIVDSGLSRRPVFEPATGLSRLETVAVSRASADQRAGRAGRTGPGRAIRLWRAEQTNALPAFDTPEILSTDLSGLILDCAAFGIGDPAALAFLDPPPEPALIEARGLLTALGAFDADGRLTEAGRRMRSLALPPRLAAMVVRAAPGTPRRLAAEFAVLVTERGLGGNDPDLAERHRRLVADRGPRARAALELARRLGADANAGESRIDTPDPALLLAEAYPDRIAVARGARGHFVLASGRGGQIEDTTRLAGAPGLIVAELQGAARAARILSAVALDKAGLAILEERYGTQEDRVLFDPASRSVRARRQRRIGRAVLSETPLPDVDPGAAAAALADGIRSLGADSLPFDTEGRRLLERLRFLNGTLGDPWPAMDEASLMDTLEAWLMPFAPGATRLSDIGAGALREGLLHRLPHGLSGQIERLAPSHYAVPTGSRLPLRYEEDKVVLAVRVQELFGLTQHPAIAGGRMPLTLELLSPAHRPIQITLDLPGFWSGSWRDVRAALRGRYPKHVWPEDPARAAPTARARRPGEPAPGV